MQIYNFFTKFEVHMYVCVILLSVIRPIYDTIYVRWLHANQWSACDVIDSLYALQFWSIVHLYLFDSILLAKMDLFEPNLADGRGIWSCTFSAKSFQCFWLAAVKWKQIFSSGQHSNSATIVAGNGGNFRRQFVAEFGDSRRIRRQSPNSAIIVAENGDCRRI